MPRRCERRGEENNMDRIEEMTEYLPPSAKREQKKFEVRTDETGCPVLFYGDEPAADAYRPSLDAELNMLDWDDEGRPRIRTLSGGGRSRLAPGQFFGMWAKADGFSLLGALKPLTETPNWVVWRWAIVKNKSGKEKRTKVPYRPDRPTVKAKSNDATTWGDYAAARDVAEAGQADGIGFCLYATEFAAFDLDDCRNPDTGEIAPWARALVERVASYTEVTVSGTGLRIIGRGTGEKVHRKQAVENGGTLETYRRAERYIVMTGDALPGSAMTLENIDNNIDEVVAELDAVKKKNKKSKASNADAEDISHEDEIEDIIKNGCGGRFEGDRSRAVWFVINELLRRGFYEELIETRLLDKDNRISEHVYDQAGSPEQYVRRQVEKAIKDISLAVGENGKPAASQANIRVALLKLAVRVRYNQFADRTMISGLEGFGPTVDDAAADRIWLLIDERFRLLPKKELFLTVLIDTARRNGFHPVKDYLDKLKWDEVPRIDKWLSTYAGAESSPYVDAVGALVLVAAVRRIRQPGCKFDEMLVLEGKQGKGKSQALSALAVNPDWFSDDLPLNADGKRAIESLHGRWIVEAAELSGMTKGDIEHLKAFLARQIDRARMAYGRLVSEVPRQCIVVGTTNSSVYLRDLTGNRRIWPVPIEEFDIAALTRDLDRLWAEAAVREAQGANIRLDRSLWAEAAKEQKQRTIDDPFYEALYGALDGLQGKIATDKLWNVVGIDAGHRTQEQNRRLTEAMAQLGWARPKNRSISVDGRKVSGFVKGPEPWENVSPKM
jgi:predicted P-loop ATPase